jgi:DNA-binding Xre family transcriptional regulator
LIIYTPLWETMRKKGVTTYTLRDKYKISGSTIQRLKKNMSVSTNTLDDLCHILNCRLSDIAEHIEERP